MTKASCPSPTSRRSCSSGRVSAGSTYEISPLWHLANETTAAAAAATVDSVAAAGSGGAISTEREVII